MGTFLSQTITVKSFLTALVVIFTFFVSGSTMYWQLKVTEAVDMEKGKQQTREFMAMKVQLNRIEVIVRELQEYHE